MTTSTLRELDHRFNDGIDVRLFWRPEDDRVLVAVADSRTGQAFTITVAKDQRALDVFHHPFAYADGAEPEPGGLAPLTAT
jgi:hypothetical protein